MGLLLTGLLNARCPHCRRNMIGGCYSAAEGQQMPCPHCGRWAAFDVHQALWMEAPWQEHAPDENLPTHDAAAWAAAVREVDGI